MKIQIHQLELVVGSCEEDKKYYEKSLGYWYVLIKIKMLLHGSLQPIM